MGRKCDSQKTWDRKTARCDRRPGWSTVGGGGRAAVVRGRAGRGGGPGGARLVASARMKHVATAAVVLLAGLLAGLPAGCQAKRREPPGASPGAAASGPGAAPAGPGGSAASQAPSPVPPPPSGAAVVAAAAAAGQAPDFCRAGLEMIDQAACKTPDDKQRLVEPRKAIGGLVDALSKMGAADPRQTQVMCAQMLLAIEHDAAKLGCAVAIDASQRQQMTALLDAWYGQRTKVEPTGDAAADAVIARIAAVRDAACECRDAACLDRVDPQLVAIGAMPASAPPAARTLAGKLLDDAARCAARARTPAPPALPPAPASAPTPR